MPTVQFPRFKIILVCCALSLIGTTGSAQTQAQLQQQLNATRTAEAARQEQLRQQQLTYQRQIEETRQRAAAQQQLAATRQAEANRQEQLRQQQLTYQRQVEQTRHNEQQRITQQNVQAQQQRVAEQQRQADAARQQQIQLQQQLAVTRQAEANRQEALRQQQITYQNQINQARQQEQQRQAEQQQAQLQQQLAATRKAEETRQDQIQEQQRIAQQNEQIRQQVSARQAEQARQQADLARQNQLRQEEIVRKQIVQAAATKQPLTGTGSTNQPLQQATQQQIQLRDQLNQVRQAEREKSQAAAQQVSQAKQLETLRQQQTWDQINAAKSRGDDVQVKALINTLPQNSRGAAIDSIYGGAREVDMTQFVGVTGAVKGAVVTGGKFLLKEAVKDIATYEAKKVTQATTVRQAENYIAKQEIKSINISKNAGSYRPTRNLPQDTYGNKIPDGISPHTQIGTKSGRSGDYTQARTWDRNSEGKLVPKKDIDFTDHGRPINHTNPHQHDWYQNPTGGTLGRSKISKTLITQ